MLISIMRHRNCSFLYEILIFGINFFILFAIEKKLTTLPVTILKIPYFFFKIRLTHTLAKSLI